jgi:hypothetical protein
LQQAFKVTTFTVTILWARLSWDNVGVVYILAIVTLTSHGVENAVWPPSENIREQYAAWYIHDCGIKTNSYHLRRAYRLVYP